MAGVRLAELRRPFQLQTACNWAHAAVFLGPRWATPSPCLALGTPERAGRVSGHLAGEEPSSEATVSSGLLACAKDLACVYENSPLFCLNSKKQKGRLNKHAIYCSERLS